MTEPEPQNRTFELITHFLRSLWQHGLRHVIISPGSRSTPLTLAVAGLPRLHKSVILDERSAAFTALGIGKATALPAALICTSGTAVANYFPAVIEARKSGVPLLLLTADRPTQLHDTGANQTIDQQKIFGDYPVLFHQIGERQRQVESMRRVAARSIHFARERRGPVHLNFPFSKPLEPDKDFANSVIEKKTTSAEEPTIKFPKDQTKSFRFDDDILYEIHTADRPLIIIGQLAPKTKLEYIFWLAESLEVPVLSEQGLTIPEYGIPGFEGFLRSEQNLQSLAPDLILRFGRQPASKSLLLAIRKWNPARHIHFSDTGQQSDIANSTTDFIDWNGHFFDASTFHKKPQQWLSKWKQYQRNYFKKVNTMLGREQTLTDGHVYHQLAPSIPENWFAFISNSFPARDHSMFGRWAAQKKFTNRGASGIDGITSTAMGINLGSEQAGILFTGDLAFLHDTNALLNHRKLAESLVVVVINNRGGSIFRMLPVTKHEEYFEQYFETPQQANISALAESYGLDTLKVETPEALHRINLKKMAVESSKKLHIIECVTDAERSMQLRRALWETAL